MESHPVITASIPIGGGIAYASYNANKGSEDTDKGAAKSNADINDAALTNPAATNGTTGSVTYTPDQIPTDSTSTSTVVWPW